MVCRMGEMRDAMVVVVVVGALERPYWLFLLTIEVCVSGCNGVVGCGCGDAGGNDMYVYN